MDRMSVVLFSTALLTACSHPPRLVRSGDDLRFENFAVPARGAWVYLLDPNTPNVPIGLVTVVNPQAATATWFCQPSANLYELTASGVPVMELEPDRPWRLENCGGTYREDRDACKNLDDAICDAGFRYLFINLGANDGVTETDVYRVYGRMIFDPDTSARYATDLGYCHIVPPVYDSNAYCRLDVRDYPVYDKQGDGTGFVRLEAR